VWRLVRATRPEAWREMGFRPPRVRTFNGFAYLLSLGFRDRSLLPRAGAPLLVEADEWLRGAAPLLGLRALAVWEKAA
jgi:hypothetical protein